MAIIDSLSTAELSTMCINIDESIALKETVAKYFNQLNEERDEAYACFGFSFLFSKSQN